MNRRNLLKRFLLALPGVAYAQQLFHGASLATFVFQTTKTTGFHPSFTKTGATLYWKWPDGTYTSSNAPTKTLAAGTKTVRAQSQDGFGKVINFAASSQNLTGALPSFAACTALVSFSCANNSLSGTLPSFAACTLLTSFACGIGNSFSGTLPSFATCTALTTFDCDNNSLTGTLPSFAACTALDTWKCQINNFSGALPSFAACTLLTTFYAYGNSFSGTLPSFATCTLLTDFRGGTAAGSNLFSNVVAGSFATQKSLSSFYLGYCALPAAAVNQVLADCVVSLGISGRVLCAVILSGGTNAAPTGQGILDKATLISAGWTCTTT